MLRQSRIRRFAQVFLGAVGAMVAALWLLQPEPPGSSNAPTTVSSSEKRIAVSGQGVAPTAKSINPSASSHAEPDDTVTHFKRLNRYALGTQSLTTDQNDLIKPGARHEQRRPLTRDPMSPVAGWEMLLTADRYFIVGAESAEVLLDLWWNNQLMPLTYIRLRAEARADDGMPLIASVPFLLRDGRVVAQFIPDQFWPNIAGPVALYAEFASPGLTLREARLDFHFTGSDRIPAHFVSVDSDYLSDGDLVFDIELNVHTQGQFRLSANIHDQRGVPFGHTRLNTQLKRGKQVVNLRFDGLLMHDAQAESPFFLTTLRGERLNPLSSSGSDHMPQLAERYQSGAYTRGQFRNTAAPSPRRQRMLELYQNALDRGVRFTPGE